MKHDNCGGRLNFLYADVEDGEIYEYYCCMKCGEYVRKPFDILGVEK